ncbi:hypothetical protein [Microbacterium album]|uniref:Uncharacterized protein n=1 Tax=Microbacterium album TaxID=2053191 RepID=A0A917ICZ9_9MICO|nr:hypothetical protein [Microbacterium album]GGH36419.1 hypothetical protein GCM10010921_05550 [Microbacterium album]
MGGDYIGPMGLGIGMMIFAIILYLGIFALSLWIFYLIIRTAVKHGILKADEERAARGAYGAPRPGATHYPGGAHGYGRPVP